MIIRDTVQVGQMRFRLIEKASALEPDFFAPRYYFDARHDGLTSYTGILYLDHDPDRARDLFRRHIDKTAARLMAGQDAGN